MNPLSPVEESKPAMCLSPQEKLKSGGGLAAQRKKKTHAAGALTGASDAKKARLDDLGFKTDLELDLDGWISDDNLRAMDFDDRLNQEIDWVAHDEMDLSLSLDFAQDGVGVSVGVSAVVDGDEVNDFGFGPSSFLSPLRGGLAFEDASEMASTFVDPETLEPTSRAKDAEKLLMSFDTMNFTIPSPTSASSKKKRASLFSKKDDSTNIVAGAAAAAKTQTSASGSLQAATVGTTSVVAEELRKEHARMSAGGSSAAALATTSPTDPFLGVLNLASTSRTPTSTLPHAEKKIGSYSPQARKLRIQKFHEKRKNRTWKKSIKYDCRKKLADDRPRIKGRFVRVLENASDAKDDGAASPTAPASVPASGPTVSACLSGTTSPSVATASGCASPTSPAGAMAPPTMSLPVGSVKASSYGSALEIKPELQSTPVQSPATATVVAASAATHIARMIASV